MSSKVQDLDLSTGGNKIEKLKEINQSESDIWKIPLHGRDCVLYAFIVLA